MFGQYKSFPTIPQRIVYYTSTLSPKKLQQALAETCHKLNTETLTPEQLDTPAIHQCTISFEFGIAETNNFNYLDQKETNRLQQTINKQPLQTMDFLCITRYHKNNQQKPKPLKFDYQMIRFTFDKNLVEVQAYHEKGPMHIMTDEIINLLITRINDMFPRKALKPIEVV
jgi:hypothetical protein